MRPRITVLDDYQDVIAWSPHLTDEQAAAAGVRRVGKRELFHISDYVPVHLVLADGTRGLGPRTGVTRGAAGSPRGARSAFQAIARP